MEKELLELLDKLVGFVESASPVIWATAQRQVGADMATRAIWMVVVFSSIVVSIKLGRKLWANGAVSSEADTEDFYVLSSVLHIIAVVLTVVLFVLITDVVNMLINPSYYAIQNILNFLP